MGFGFIIEMLRSFLLLAFAVSFLSSSGQKEEPLVIYKCDPPGHEVMNISPYPPVLKLKKDELERLLNDALDFSVLEQDSTLTIYIWVIINCDSSATYEHFQKGNINIHPELGYQLTELLKNNCSWSPGKSSVEFTKTILQKVNNKIIHLQQYTYHLTRFGISLKFIIQNRKIKLVSDITTI